LGQILKARAKRQLELDTYKYGNSYGSPRKNEKAEDDSDKAENLQKDIDEANGRKSFEDSTVSILNKSAHCLSDLDVPVSRGSLNFEIERSGKSGKSLCTLYTGARTLEALPLKCRYAQRALTVSKRRFI
jgi:hypothetical protein